MSFLEEEGRDLFIALQNHKVRYLLVGGMAVNFHGYNRSTGDIDLWVDDSPENRQLLVAALKEYGIAGANSFLTLPLIAGYSELLLHSGMYVDLMCELKFFKQEHFAYAFETAETYLLEGNVTLKVINIHSLLEEKKKSSRPRDRDDAEKLEHILQKRN